MLQHYMFFKEKYFLIRGTNRKECCSNVLLYPKFSVSSMTNIKALTKILGPKTPYAPLNIYRDIYTSTE